MPAPERSLRPVQRPSPQQDVATPEQNTGGAGNGALQDVLNDRTVRTRAIEKMRVWLQQQVAAIGSLSGEARTQRAEAVLGTLESTWSQLLSGESPDAVQLPTSPTAAPTNAANVALPPELIGEVRPVITLLESGAHNGTDSTAESNAHNGTDWNSRLGVPQYRTQSDNLVAPEATCNTTTLAMVMERLGINRQNVVDALEKRIQKKWVNEQKRAGKITAKRANELLADLSLVNEEPGWDRDAAWKKAARSYIDNQMLDKPYQRVRGEGTVGTATRDDIAGKLRENAQMEDLLDFLAHEMGVERYSLVGEPGRVLDEVSPTGLPPDAEKLWGGTPWKDILERTRSTLEAGGAAALSFKHKGSRESGATHIVSVQSARDDGFVLDDPYGVVRPTYNRRTYDDAYWDSTTYQQRDNRGRMVTKEKLIADRDNRKNAQHGFDDWGAAAARNFDNDEVKGRDSFMSKDLVTSSMNYLQLFNRGKSVPRPQPRPNRE